MVIAKITIFAIVLITSGRITASDVLSTSRNSSNENSRRRGFGSPVVASRRNNELPIVVRHDYKSTATFGGPVVANRSSGPPIFSLPPPPVPPLPASPSTQNITTIRTESNDILGLCAFPPYFERDVCISHEYFGRPLSECETTWALGLFVSVVMLLGITIVAMNMLIILVAVCNPKIRTQYYAIKVSLAVADGIIGILLLVALLPNVFSIRNLNEEEVVRFLIETANSPVAIVVGSLLNVSKQASLLHLMFLSIERFTAINWPLWHMGRKKTSVVAILVAIWTVSITSAFTPAAFPKYFAYQLQPAVQLHMMTLTPLPKLGWQGPIYAIFTLLIPYIITVTFCVMTGVVSFRKLREASLLFGKVHRPSDYEDSSRISGTTDSSGAHLEGPIQTKKSMQPEIAVFVTLLIMIAAFTITLLPFTLVVILFVSEALDCTNYTIPYVTTFYIGLLNSIANGLIYSVRDDKFRKSVRELASSLKVTCQKSDT